MDEQNPDNKKLPWFGPKRFGYGARATSWQGRLVILPLIILEVFVVTAAPSHFPSWFKPKTVGTGFTPATWQGWVVTIAPIFLMLAVVRLVIYRQRQK